LKKLLYPFYLIFIVGLILEIILRIYNPIPLRLKGDKIILPTNQNYTFKNSYPCFDSLVVHTKNEMGFRGPSMPSNFKEKNSIIAIGGSTTECYFISDDKVWTQVMQDSLIKYDPTIWINNAGLNGHSTFGHNVLLEDIVAPLKPKYVLFLIGINDVDRKDLGDFDKMAMQGTYVGNGWKEWLKTLSNNSELFNLFNNLIKAQNAKDKEIFVDKIWTLNPQDTISESKIYVVDYLKSLDPLVEEYILRVASLDSTCKANHITPIFITQPILLGYGIDPVTGTDLAKYEYSKTLNGEFYWQKLEKYNSALLKYTKKNNSLSIDLARLLPKSSQYYSDQMHYTNDGSIMVGNIIQNEFRSLTMQNKIVK
jgi:lysophospholipase L1-like esterase